MTENKRFTRKKRISRYGHGLWWEYYYDGQEINIDELIPFVNNLLDEKEQLEEENKELKQENEQLKRSIECQNETIKE